MIGGPILGGASVLKFDPATVNVFAAGNSIIYGTGSTDRLTKAWVKLIEQVDPLLAAGMTVNNQGIGGQTIASVKPGYTSMVNTMASLVNLLSTTKTNVVIIGEFTNEIGSVMTNTGNGADGALAHSVWVTYCNNLRAAAAAKGAKIVIVTVSTIPAGQAQSPDAANIAYVLDVNENGFKVANTLMRNTWRTYADAFIDIAALPTFANMYDTSNYTYASLYGSNMYHQLNAGYDGYHPGDAGYAYMATAAPQVLRRLPRAR